MDLNKLMETVAANIPLKTKRLIGLTIQTCLLLYALARAVDQTHIPEINLTAITLLFTLSSMFMSTGLIAQDVTDRADVQKQIDKLAAHVGIETKEK